MASRSPPTMPTLSKFTFGHLLLLVSLFLTILGARFRTIENYGSDLPYWDQWDGEASELYKPCLENRLTMREFFAPHNEHRIVLGRLLFMGLFLADRHHWNPKVQMAANSLLAAVLALVIAVLALRTMPVLAGIGFAAMIALFFVMTAAWENTLWGFQSQFYFLPLAALLHISCSLLARPRSLAWWLAPLAGIAGLLSMASGVLSSVAVLAAVVLRALHERKFERNDGYVLGTNAAIVCAGWFLRVSVPGHEPMMAQTFSQGLDAWLHQLAWPLPGVPWGAVLRLLPPVALAFLYWRRRTESRNALVLLAATVWCWMVSAAIAYGRGALDHGVVSRYTDLFAVGILITLLDLATIVSVATRFRRFWALFAVVCTVAAISGLAARNAESYEEIVRHLPTINRARISAVRTYVATHDSSFLEKIPWWEIPFPSPTYLAQLLDDAQVRKILPASVRPPDAPVTPAPLSAFALRALNSWPWLLAFGAIFGSWGLLAGLPNIRGGLVAPKGLGSYFLAGLSAAIAASPPFLEATRAREFYFFEVSLTSDRQTVARIYYDNGHGFSEKDSSKTFVPVVGMPATYRLPLPIGSLLSLRFDPTLQEGKTTIAFARIVDGSGHELRRFGPGDFVPVQQIEKSKIEGDALHVETVAQANDPIIRVKLGAPLILRWGPRQWLQAYAPSCAALGCLALLIAATIKPRGTG